MRFLLATGVLLSSFFASAGVAAQVKVVFPQNRSAYQTNEWIDLSVVRSSDQPLAAGDLVLSLQGDDGSRLGFTLPVAKPDAEANPRAAVEHVRLDGWLLRPGRYTLEAVCDGAKTSAELEVYSHVRRSSFRLVNWGARAKDREQLPEGEDNLGYNLFMGGQDDEGNLIRAGADYMANCVMSGGHQMDLRVECDWSDPYVIRGGTRRVVRRAFIDRARPNVAGVHFYDEPGLTWHTHPETKEWTPHGIPAQARSYEAATGQNPPSYKTLDPKDPEQVARWARWARWKLGLMDAAWKDAQFGVSEVRPDFLSVTQSQYGYSAFTDGYYFNVVRSLPVISGHGGYHDFGPGYFNPSLFLEFARARDLARPNWYLPCWYGNTTADEFRLEQYLSLQTNIQGLMSPPEIDPFQPSKVPAAQGVVESNHLAGRVGTVFTTLPVTPPPVALLFSLSQMIHAQTLDRSVNYAHETNHGKKVGFSYLAGKLLQHQFMPVLDEDVQDGTLAARHKAVLLTALDYLDPAVIDGLEAFAKQGGLVLMTGDCTVKVAGAVRLDVSPRFAQQEKIDELYKAKKYQEAAPLVSMRESLKAARTLADALRPHLERAGIKPPLTSDEPGIVVTRQAGGHVEYLFAVNASHDPQGNPMLGMKAVRATLGLEADGRPVYDLVHGGVVKEFTAQGGRLQGQFPFGPGQMRVFARTARPVGTVRAATPLLHRDYTLAESPLRLDVGAALLDDKGGLLSGSFPLRVRVIDPLGAVRFDLYRATDRGTLNLSLPLAVNDPAGTWKVQVTELLNNTEDTVAFPFESVRTCSAAAGTVPRAVHLPAERDHVFRFFRTHQRVTLVKGSGAYNDEAAARLAKILQPWNVTCVMVSAAEANKARFLSEEEAKTWSGLDYAASGQIKPGDKNNPALVGFAVPGPVILLGTPEDNPLIKTLLETRFLPYKPSPDQMPGPGRGLVAWQRDAVGVGQESLTLIAYDAKGMAEAVGTTYEMLAGIEPLTPVSLARQSTVAPATKSATPPEAALEWSVSLADRIDGLRAADGKLTALTHAGTLAEVTTDGKVSSEKGLDGSEYRKLLDAVRAPVDASALAERKKKADARRLVKLAAANGPGTAVAYWGGTVAVYDQAGKLQAERRLPQDVTALTWFGPRLIVGDADGRVMALGLK